MSEPSASPEVQRTTGVAPAPANAALTVAPATKGLAGTVTVPGDKSISHRAVLLGALSTQPVTVEGFLVSADTLATVEAVRAFGVRIDGPVRGGSARLLVCGGGWDALKEPGDVVDVCNAGTLIRLLPGIAAGLPFLTMLTGDASIRRRPMRRILAPLAEMGAETAGRADDSLAPIMIRGGRLHGITHRMEVASAQVKSCVLLAGLRAEGATTVVEPAPSRDHTERMLAAAGVSVESQRAEDGSNIVRLHPGRAAAGIDLREVRVPGDFSSAAFLIVAALLTPGSDVSIDGVGLNPTRTGFLDVLGRMGADIGVEEQAAAGNEPLGRITARTSELRAVDVEGPQVANVIDELPLFLLAAARAAGVSRLRGAGELRAKESDRLAAMAALLRALDVKVEERTDGMDVHGRPGGWEGGAVRAFADHRIAMAGVVAGLASTSGVTLDDPSCIAISYPEFVTTVETLRA